MDTVKMVQFLNKKQFLLSPEDIFLVSIPASLSWVLT